jgi:hypothetical protein
MKRPWNAIILIELVLLVALLALASITAKTPRAIPVTAEFAASCPPAYAVLLPPAATSQSF